ncbi:MAG TPA: hypothetical protein VEI97_10875, partial [bacterium]|nr:hypothetical protein [bacterium]
FNSQTATGPLHPLNAYWNYDVSVVNREDADEPNDDDNGATYSDRTLRTDIFRAVGGTYHRSLFQQASTNRDLEDWHQYKLYGGRKYLFTVTNSNGTWGTWTFTLRVVNANGSAVITRVNQTASSFTFYATPGGTTAQNYWVQVVGTPTSRRGNSVYFAKYSLQAVEVATAGPQVHAVTPNSVVVGKTGEKVTWAAEASGGALSYSWNFGNGASTPVDNGQTCNNCAYVAASHSATVASPKMVLGPPGQYSGTLTVTNSLGESDPFPFQYTVSSWGGDRDIAVDVRMVQVNDATEPRKFGGLNSWSYLDVSNWFHTHVTPVFRGTGVELVVSSFDWINSSEYFRLDSATERDAFIDAHFPNNQPARLTVWVVDALAGGTGYAYDRQCDMKNDHRGAIVVGVGTLADDVNTVAHELGHVMSLPHIRTTTSPLTNANYNLMSYGTTSNDLCTCIGREGSLPGCAGTMLHTTTPMNQYDAMAKWVETNL